MSPAQTGGCRPTSVSFNSSLDPLQQSSILSAVGVPTDDVDVVTTGPGLLAVPPGVESNFVVQRAGVPFTAIAVVATDPFNFTVTIPGGAGALERLRYTGPDPVWPNLAGGQLLAFDVPLPFP